MPTLQWIGKEKVVNHHLDVPFRVLEHQYGFTENGEQSAPVNSGNKIIHGDNLEALKALLPEYEGRIKCVYIDPPYNTGKESWIYNDKVAHPKIRKWLGQVVGKDEEDLSRHDKWLCMMYPRLQLLHKLLKAQDGIIFISIDENEHFHLRCLMNEIFGKDRYAGEFVWNTRHSQQQGLIASYHEYILVYTKCKAKNYPNFRSDGGNIVAGALKKISKKNGASDFTFPPGIRCEAEDGTEFTGKWGDVETVELVSGKFVVKDGVTASEMTLRAGWTQKDQMQKLYYSNEPVLDTKGQLVKEFYFTSTGKLKSVKARTRITPNSILDEFGTVSQATKELGAILGNEEFGQPKPHRLISYLLSLSTSGNDIILDSFAGSGTTGHAVLLQNQEDAQNRKFICIEMEDYSDVITAERIKRVIRGYQDEESVPGGFDYFKVGAPLFKEDGSLNGACGRNTIRQYIWYTETQQSLSTPDSHNEFLLGKWNDTAYYFFYDEDRTTSLDYEFLKTIDRGFLADRYIIYADNCLLSEEFMQNRKITFKKIPRDITRF